LLAGESEPGVPASQRVCLHFSARVHAARPHGMKLEKRQEGQQAGETASNNTATEPVDDDTTVGIDRKLALVHENRNGGHLGQSGGNDERGNADAGMHSGIDEM
jgi:hypothetical protein